MKIEGKQIVILELFAFRLSNWVENIARAIATVVVILANFIQKCNWMNKN